MLTLHRVLMVSTLLILSTTAVVNAAGLPRPTLGPVERIAAKPAQTLKSGNFVAVEHPTQGKAKIIAENGKRYIEFSADFKTDNGPDLKVILYRGKQVPLNIPEGSYTSLASLRKVNGTQRYEIPTGLNLTEFGSVAIWCQQFNATFGYAPLK